MSTVLIKKNLPLVLGFLIGVILVFEWFIPTDIGSSIGTGIRESGIIINSFAIMVGIVGLAITGVKKIQKQEKEWYFDAWTLVVAAIFILIGVAQGSQHDNYQWIYQSVLLPLSATMYGSISFYIAAAAYRVLRFRSKEAVILLVPAMILVLGNTPMISSVWTGFVDTGGWIMSTITQPAYRGIMIGTALGTMATAVRIIIGRETGWLGAKEEGE